MSRIFLGVNPAHLYYSFIFCRVRAVFDHTVITSTRIDWCDQLKIAPYLLICLILLLSVGCVLFLNAPKALIYCYWNTIMPCPTTAVYTFLEERSFSLL